MPPSRWVWPLIRSAACAVQHSWTSMGTVEAQLLHSRQVWLNVNLRNCTFFIYHSAHWIFWGTRVGIRSGPGFQFCSGPMQHSSAGPPMYDNHMSRVVAFQTGWAPNLLNSLCKMTQLNIACTHFRDTQALHQGPANDTFFASFFLKSG